MEKEILKLIPLRTRVRLKDSNLLGNITAVNIRDNNYIQYEIAYWNDSSPQEAWFLDYQFDIVEDDYEHKSVGFDIEFVKRKRV